MVTSLNQRVAAREASYEMIQYISSRGVPTGAVGTFQQRVGTLPAGSVVLAAATRVVTTLTGTTPILSLGTVAGSYVDLVTTLTVAAGSQIIAPTGALVQPLAADTDIWMQVTGTATGDVVVIVQFAKPLA